MTTHVWVGTGETRERLSAPTAGDAAGDPDALGEPQDDEPAIATILERRSFRESYDRTKVIARRDLETIVRCGLAAPSSKHAKPWRLHIVEDPALLDEVARVAGTSPGVESYVPRNLWSLAPQLDRWPSSAEDSANVLAQVSAAIFVENRGPFFGGRRELLKAIAARETEVLEALDNVLDQLNNSGEETLRQRIRELLATIRSSLVGYSFEMIGIGAAVENMFLAAQALQIQCCFMGDIVIAEDHVKDVLKIEGDFAGVLALGYSSEGVPARGHLINIDDPNYAVWHSDQP